MSDIYKDSKGNQYATAAEADAAEKKYAQPSMDDTLNKMVSSGSYTASADMIRRANDTNYGQDIWKRTVEDNPDFQKMKALREDYAKGYDGEQLGNLRQTARGEIAGQQQQAQRTLQGRLGRGGVGGARGAAMVGSQSQQGVNTVADSERKMSLDNYNIKKQGVNDLNDYISRNALGKLGSGAGYASMGSSDYAAQQGTKNNTGGGGGLCCFIFLEARYGNGSMDSVVRRFRDENMNDQNRRGYYKLSEVLVPLMRKSFVAKALVRVFMTDPLVSYGKAYYGTGSKFGFVFKPVVNFWLNTFEYLGKDHKFIRENGEIV